jgi:hypothetical protein
MDEHCLVSFHDGTNLLQMFNVFTIFFHIVQCQKKLVLCAIFLIIRLGPIAL